MKVVAGSLIAGVVSLPRILGYSVFGSVLGACLGGGYSKIMD
jgi:hypothetical protein